MAKGDQTKCVGVVKINMTDYIEPINQKRRTEKLEKCVDKEATITYTVKA